jgi:hypothetical protein
MNEIHVPFDFTPFSTTIKTSGYTVPAGYRARVTPLAYNFLIDTVSPMFSHSKNFHSIGSNNDYYLVGEPGPYFAQMAQTGASSPTYSFHWVSGALNYQLNASSGLDMEVLGAASAGASLPSTSAGSGAIYVRHGYSLPPSVLSVEFYHKKIPPLWVPTGTVLAGNRYVVELYANQA